MGNNKVLLAGLIGGITFFILGWVVYGMLLMDYMTANAGSATGVSKSETEMSFLWIIISNLASGYLMAVILGNYAKVSGAMAGARIALLVGFLMALGFDGIMYGTTNVMNMNAMLVDIVVSTVMTTIVGGVVGAVLGMGKK